MKNGVWWLMLVQLQSSPSVVQRHRNIDLELEKPDLGNGRFLIIFLIGRGIQLMKRLSDAVDQSVSFDGRQ